MSIYNVRARRHTHPRLAEEPPLAAVLEWRLPEARLAESVSSAEGFLDFSVELESEDHLEAINQLIEASERIGYSVIDANVEEWIGREVEGVAVSALGAGGAVQAKIGNPVLSLAVALAAGYIGHQVGAQLGRFEVVYHLVPASSGWVLEPASQGPAGSLTTEQP